VSFLQSSEDSFFAVPSWLLIVSVKWRASLLGYFNRFCYLLTNLPPTLFFKRNVMMWTYAFVETWCLNFTPVVELHKRPDFYIVFPVNQPLPDYRLQMTCCYSDFSFLFSTFLLTLLWFDVCRSHNQFVLVLELFGFSTTFCCLTYTVTVWRPLEATGFMTLLNTHT